LPDLSRKRERERLPVRREPHWQRLAKGCYLGFRRGPDTWIARFKKTYRALDAVASDDFDRAKHEADDWFAQLGATGVRQAVRGTVRNALEAYLADLERHGRPEAARDALWRFKLVVYKDAIADLSLEASARNDFLEWRDRLLPCRKARSVNRHVRSVVAGLNRALELGHVGNPAAWRLKALSDDVEEEGETAVFLSIEQRKALMVAADLFMGSFLRGLELTGARPKELANTVAEDFDGETIKLAHRKGRPPKLRVRRVVLSADGVNFFERVTRGKLPKASIFTEDGQQPWRRHIWARQFRAAADKLNGEARGKVRIPPEATAYSFRHARISELLQVHGIDPLTVAAQTGTSLAMIEKAYLRFIPSAMKEKLAAVVESA
jgi:integrase